MCSVSSGHAQVAFWESFWKTLVEIDWKEGDSIHKSVNSCIYSSSHCHFPGTFLILASEALRAQGSSPLSHLLPQRKGPGGRKHLQLATCL